MAKFTTLTAFIANGKNTNISSNDIVEFEGAVTQGDGAGSTWKHDGTTGQTPSQTPADLADGLFTDASGNQYEFVPCCAYLDQTIKPEQLLFVKNTLTTANTAAYRAAFNFSLGGGILLHGVGRYRLDEKFLFDDRITMFGSNTQETEIFLEGSPAQTVETFVDWKTEYNSGDFSTSDDAPISVAFKITAAQVTFENIRITGAFVYTEARPVALPLSSYPLSPSWDVAILVQVTDFTMRNCLVEGLFGVDACLVDGSQPTGIGNTSNDRGLFDNCQFSGGLFGLAIRGAKGEPISGDNFEEMVANDTRGAGGISDFKIVDTQCFGTKVEVDTTAGDRLIRRAAEEGAIFISGQLSANVAKRIQGIRLDNVRADSKAGRYPLRLNYCNRVTLLECHTEFAITSFDTDGQTALITTDFDLLSTINTQKLRFFGGEKSGENDSLEYIDSDGNQSVFKYGYDDGNDEVRDLLAPPLGITTFVNPPEFEGSTIAGDFDYTTSRKGGVSKLSDWVSISIRVTIDAINTNPTGSMRIINLDYAARNFVEVSVAIGLVTGITLPGSSTTFRGFINEGDNFIQLVGTGGAFANVDGSDISTTANITISALYQTDDPTIVT